MAGIANAGTRVTRGLAMSGGESPAIRLCVKSVCVHAFMLCTCPHQHRDARLFSMERHGVVGSHIMGCSLT